MSYQIIKVPFGGYQLVSLLHESGASLDLIPEYGGMVHGLTLHQNGRNHQLLTTGDSDKFIKKLKPGFNGSFLAPFPNRLAFGTYSWDGQEFQMQHNDFGRPNALHGFVYDMSFDMDMSRKAHGEVTLVLEYAGDRDYYPFPFRIEHQFSLNSSELKVFTQIINTGNQKIPFGVGWHPYFNFHKKVNDLFLETPCDQYFEVGEHLIPTESKPFTEFQQQEQIGETILDTCYKVAPGKDTTMVEDREAGIKVAIKQSPEYGYIQYYIPEDRQSIAIEPMSCAPDAFNSGEGLIILDPGEKKTFEFNIYLI